MVKGGLRGQASAKTVSSVRTDVKKRLGDTDSRIAKLESGAADTGGSAESSLVPKGAKIPPLLKELRIEIMDVSMRGDDRRKPRITAIEIVDEKRTGLSVLRTTRRAERFMKLPYGATTEVTSLATRIRNKAKNPRDPKSSDDEGVSADSRVSSVSNVADIVAATEPAKETRSSPPAPVLPRKKFKVGPMELSSEDESIIVGSREEIQTPRRNEECEASSGAESFLGKEKRGRGRPPTTGKGVCKREIAAQHKKLQKLEKEVADMEEIAEGKYDPVQRWKRCRF